VLVDPPVWGFGRGLGRLQYTVKAATQRLLQVYCRAMPGWVPGLGMRPRLWQRLRLGLGLLLLLLLLLLLRLGLRLFRQGLLGLLRL